MVAIDRVLVQLIGLSFHDLNMAYTNFYFVFSSCVLFHYPSFIGSDLVFDVFLDRVSCEDGWSKWDLSSSTAQDVAT